MEIEFQLGVKAFEDGNPFSANPFASGAEEAYSWEDGWLEGLLFLEAKQ